MNETMPAPQDAYAAAYLDAERFPLTTQGDLDLQDQKLIDAVNMDDIRRMIEDGKPLSERLQGRWKEYQEKKQLAQAGDGRAAPAA